MYSWIYTKMLKCGENKYKHKQLEAIWDNLVLSLIIVLTVHFSVSVLMLVSFSWSGFWYHSPYYCIQAAITSYHNIYWGVQLMFVRMMLICKSSCITWRDGASFCFGQVKTNRTSITRKFFRLKFKMSQNVIVLFKG